VFHLDVDAIAARGWKPVKELHSVGEWLVVSTHVHIHRIVIHSILDGCVASVRKHESSYNSAGVYSHVPGCPEGVAPDGAMPGDVPSSADCR
jgi:hypothetical protein